MIERKLSPGWILGAIWLLSNLNDRLWLALDHSIPAWDQSNHLSYALTYLQALQSPDFFNGDWWRQFWMLSPKYPPLTYLMTVPFQRIWGTGQAAPVWNGDGVVLLTNWLYSGLLIVSVYLIGQQLFNRRIGLWAAAITVLLPRIYQTRLLYLLDTPLLTFAVASFACLTLWQGQKSLRKQWFWSLAFGLCLGLGLFTKQSILFYLFFPILGLSIYYLWHRAWLRILQLGCAFLFSALLWFPWYRTNWIYLFSTAQNSNAIPASLEGDPPINSWAAWVYYWNDLPLAVTWVWLIVPLVGLLLHLLGRFPQKTNDLSLKQVLPGLLWLGLYVGGTYLVCSALYNKDSRYILPYLPGLALFLAVGLTRWRGRWRWVPWATLGVGILVMQTNLFAIPGTEALSRTLNPAVFFRPHLAQIPPQPSLLVDIVHQATTANPYQRINLGVIPNTDSFNPNTLNYFGALDSFRLFGRELGSRPEQIQQDQANFDWFLTKQGDNGFAQAAQLDVAQALPQNPFFKTFHHWSSPGRADLTLDLYQRVHPSVAITPLADPVPALRLEHLEISAVAPPGQPLPVTYQWAGAWQDLNQGLVLITWQNITDPSQAWFGDHAVGLGQLLPPEQPTQGLQILEHTAMLPPATLPAGTYRLRVEYLDRRTGQATPMAFPATTVRLDPGAKALAAPPLDYVTQLRTLAPDLARGIPGLDPIFQQIDRLNLYDPTQDYLKQADASLSYRLSQNPPDPVALTYALVLSRVLQQNPPTAIAALQSLVQLDGQNPYAHAYLAFVYLYDWQGRPAEQALAPALALAPNNREINLLLGIAKLMQGNLWGAWHTLKPWL
ncbi:hypothetical protein OLK001_10090 [Synechocystis sp. LKSZ1]